MEEKRAQQLHWRHNDQLWWCRAFWVDWYIYIQSLLESTLEKDLMGLYQDTALIILRNTNSQKTDKVRKKIISILKSTDLGIEIRTNLTEVNFLDVTFNLERNAYRLYKKHEHTSTPHQIIHHKSLNTSLKPSVKSYSRILQVLKYLKNQN